MMGMRKRAAYEVKHRAKQFLDRPAVQARREFEEFVAASAADPRFAPSADDMQYIRSDATATTAFDRHYVYHTAWAARVLAQTRPRRHTDIASLIDFNAVLSAFVPVDHYDYRPPEVELTNLTVARADLTNLPFDDRSIASLSCMHVVEHVGLGRYGDPLSPTADLVAMSELSRVLAPGGDLLFVVPVGRPRVVFNAHRIYSAAMIRDAMQELQLLELVLIPSAPEDGHVVVNPDEGLVDRQEYGCGCFWFRRSQRRSS